MNNLCYAATSLPWTQTPPSLPPLLGQCHQLKGENT
jgi:hypothetical protein